MIVCVGDKIKLGHLVEALENRLCEQVSFVAENTDIRRQENEILLSAQSDTTAIIYDTRQYYNDGAELIEIIKRIYRTNKAKVILLVETTNPNNEIVKAALAQQIKYLVNCSEAAGKQKEQLEKIFTGYFDRNEREDLAAAEEQVQQEQKTLNEFVGQLYDAKQREEEKERTVIVKKKGTTQVILEYLTAFLRTIFAIVSIVLIAIALITLLYADTREAFIRVILQVWQDVRDMF